MAVGGEGAEKGGWRACREGARRGAGATTHAPIARQARHVRVRGAMPVCRLPEGWLPSCGCDARRCPRPAALHTMRRHATSPRCTWNTHTTSVQIAGPAPRSHRRQAIKPAVLACLAAQPCAATPRFLPDLDRVDAAARLADARGDEDCLVLGEVGGGDARARPHVCDLRRGVKARGRDPAVQRLLRERRVAELANGEDALLPLRRVAHGHDEGVLVQRAAAVKLRYGAAHREWVGGGEEGHRARAESREE